ncbi:MAG: hypothetical protein JST12_14065 [Armatimonadetes bacterium]|nr:hypothetical protein [Armatimonadota bacterium]
MARYFIHAADGQVYGPVELDTINQYIAEGRVVPTTLLQPESSQMRVAASTVPGLAWADNQSFKAYTPQVLSTAKYELAGSWACLAASLVLCCMPIGVHISFGIGGIVLGVMAYRKGRMSGLAAMILNLFLVVFSVWSYRALGGGGRLDPDTMRNLMRQFRGE